VRPRSDGPARYTARDVDIAVAIIRAAAPVSHQKRPHRNATNAIEHKLN
jgi:hypothetical protein